MARTLSHEEIIELLGAYALDAVDGEEEAAVRAHLETCPRCQAEVAQYREVATAIATVAADDEPPATQWERIAARLDRPETALSAPSAPSEPTLHSLDEAPAPTAGRRRTGWVLAVTGAVAAALVAVLAVQVGRLDHHVNQLQQAARSGSVSRAAAAAADNPRSQKVTLVNTANVSTAEVVISPSGTSYFLNRGLPTLAGGRTYQLWGFVGSTPISLGVLGPRPATVAFAFDRRASVHLLAVTAEQSGGAVAPTSTPVASGARSA